MYSLVMIINVEYKAEQYHISVGKSYVERFHPNDLYKLIESSYDQALMESEKLK